MKTNKTSTGCYLALAAALALASPALATKDDNTGHRRERNSYGQRDSNIGLHRGNGNISFQRDDRTGNRNGQRIRAEESRGFPSSLLAKAIPYLYFARMSL